MMRRADSGSICSQMCSSLSRHCSRYTGSCVDAIGCTCRRKPSALTPSARHDGVHRSCATVIGAVRSAIRRQRKRIQSCVLTLCGGDDGPTYSRHSRRSPESRRCGGRGRAAGHRASTACSKCRLQASLRSQAESAGSAVRGVGVAHGMRDGCRNVSAVVWHSTHCPTVSAGHRGIAHARDRTGCNHVMQRYRVRRSMQRTTDRMGIGGKSVLSIRLG